MTNRFWRGLAILFVITGLVFTTSCAKRPVKSEPGVTTAEAAQKALEERRLREEQLRQVAREGVLNQEIHFEFDKSRLLPNAKEILRDKAKWLRAHPDVSIIIEGHCDERGTNEYNMGLGDRRARSAQSFLVDLGIGRARLTTISYGEEKPADPRHNERAWTKNRRAYFAID